MKTIPCRSQPFIYHNTFYFTPSPRPAPSESTDTNSDSSDSDSDSEDNIPSSNINVQPQVLDFDEDEESGPAVTSDNPLRTKNEVIEADITIPEIEEVDQTEVLEKVGEVMSIVGQVAIVVGSPSHIASRANERTLDSDTLLVFDDRKVFGYVRILFVFYYLLFECRELGVRNVRSYHAAYVSDQVQLELPPRHRKGTGWTRSLPCTGTKQIRLRQSNKAIQG